MSAHVLLNLLNELKKSDKMRGLPCILSLFRNKFDKFNNTGVRTLDSVYQMTLKLLNNHVFTVIMSRFYHLFRNILNDVYYITLQNL